MKQNKDLDVVRNLIETYGHVAPAVDLLKGELRSDYGFEPAPQPPPSANGLANIHVVWRYRLMAGKRADFMVFLQASEETLASAVSNLAVGTRYLGTYAELPNAFSWRTIWAYESGTAIDAFKNKLAGTGNTQLKNNVKKLAGFVDPASLEIMRFALARGVVEPSLGNTIDPILNLFD